MNSGSTIPPSTSGGPPRKKPLLLTVDDHSRKLLGAVFVPTDTTWNHFEHFRRLFVLHNLPMVVYTDGLSLFGHDSMADGADAQARQLFDLCEPVEILEGAQPADLWTSRDGSQLTAWVNAALLFRPVHDVLNVIMGTEFVLERASLITSPDDSVESHRLNLVKTVFHHLIASARWIGEAT